MGIVLTANQYKLLRRCAAYADRLIRHDIFHDPDGWGGQEAINRTQCPAEFEEALISLRLTLDAIAAAGLDVTFADGQYVISRDIT